MTNEEWDAGIEEPEDQVGDAIEVEEEDEFVPFPDPDEDLPDTDPAPEG
jgi:hypothetical protein